MVQFCVIAIRVVFPSSGSVWLLVVINVVRFGRFPRVVNLAGQRRFAFWLAMIKRHFRPFFGRFSRFRPVMGFLIENVQEPLSSPFWRSSSISGPKFENVRN